MTLSSTTTKIAYAGNGTTTVFAFPYYFLANADLEVISTVDATGVDTTEILDTDYTVSGAGVLVGGSITMAVAPASGETLTIRRNLSPVQETDFVANDPLDAETLERAIDRVVMLIQQSVDERGRAIHYPTSEDAAMSAELPSALVRASKYFAFAADGSITMADTPTIDTAVLVVVSASDPGHATGRIWIDTATAATLIVKQSDGADWSELWRVDTTNNVKYFGADQKLVSADAGATEGPTLTLDRNSASPANSDLLGVVAWAMRSSTAVARTCAKIIASIVDVTNASEDIRLSFQTIIAGTLATRGYIGAGLVIGAPTSGDKGAGSLNAEAIYVNGSAVSGMPRSYLAGLGLTIGTDTNNDIDIAVGACRDSTNAADMVLASALTKRSDATWAVGTGNGGMDTGTKGTSDWLNLWIIKRSDTSVVEALFSKSATAPTMPANYDFKRRIGAVRIDGSGNLEAFRQIGDTFEFITPTLDLDVTDAATVATRTIAHVPDGVRCLALLTIFFSCSTNMTGTTQAAGTRLFATDLTDSAVAANAAPLATFTETSPSGAKEGGGDMTVLTDTSAQIKTRSAAASTTLRIVTRGYVDRRGRDD